MLAPLGRHGIILEDDMLFDVTFESGLRITVQAPTAAEAALRAEDIGPILSMVKSPETMVGLLTRLV